MSASTATAFFSHVSDGVAADLQRPRYPTLRRALCQQPHNGVLCRGRQGAAFRLRREHLLAPLATELLAPATVLPEANHQRRTLTKRTRSS